MRPDEDTIAQALMDATEDYFDRIDRMTHVEDEDLWRPYYAPEPPRPASVRVQVQRRHGLGFSQPEAD